MQGRSQGEGGALGARAPPLTKTPCVYLTLTAILLFHFHFHYQIRWFSVYHRFIYFIDIDITTR
jgi:hypothetical protein